MTVFWFKPFALLFASPFLHTLASFTVTLLHTLFTYFPVSPLFTTIRTTIQEHKRDSPLLLCNPRSSTKSTEPNAERERDRAKEKPQKETLYTRSRRKTIAILGCRPNWQICFHDFTDQYRTVSAGKLSQTEVPTFHCTMGPNPTEIEPLFMRFFRKNKRTRFSRYQRYRAKSRFWHPKPRMITTLKFLHWWR